METLDILIINAAVYKIPLEGYGGLEAIVHDLAAGIAKIGHNVTVASPYGSTVKGCKIIETVPPSIKDEEQAANEVVLTNLREEGTHYDVINDHTWQRWLIHNKEEMGLKIINTLHHPDSYSTPPPVRYPCFVSPSQAAGEYISVKLGVPVRVIPHGIPIDNFNYRESEEKENFYLTLARISPEKGIHQLIDVARRCRVKLYIAGDDIFPPDQAYVSQIIRRCHDTKGLVRYLGPISHEKKIELLSKSKALLHAPLLPYREIFGLNLVEAMASGTPVIAYNNSAIPEVVGKGGAIVENADGMAMVIDAIEKGEITINSKSCLEQAKQFTVENMVENYVDAFKGVIENGIEW